MFLKNFLLPAAFLVALPAHAELVVDGARPAQVQPQRVAVIAQPVIQPQVVTVHATPVVVPAQAPSLERSLSRIDYWADQIPVAMAVTQVLPDGFRAYSMGLSADELQRKVSWSGSATWLDILSSVTGKAGLSANVLPAQRAVLLYRQGNPVPVASDIRYGVPLLVTTKVNVAPAVATVTPPVSRAVIYPSGTVASSPATVAMPSAGGSWVLSPKLTLRQNVENWAKTAGMNAVVWDAVDYEVVAPATFSGAFASPEGPLAQLIRAYENSDQPLQVRLSLRDRVVYVSNRNYQPTLVDPNTPAEIVPDLFRN